MSVAAIVMTVALVAVDQEQIVGKWRFAKIQQEDGRFLDLEKYEIGAEWYFFNDGRVQNQTEDTWGRWTLNEDRLTIDFEDDKVPIKKWKIVSVDDKEMVIEQEVKGKMLATHIKRLAQE